ncbi:MAG: SDR family NAD(P)-dependent oxidoreductase [Anaerolineales bacterium]|nr:SDR family NAD(P)-dependent oxidoreductase [Anaerolineales bacterium]MCA9927157.1 SDR family NAD(P)-dependent oxidoreductase [Anaerolineales bacterium]
MGEHILITGGAGFIGSHLADALLIQGHQVTVLDNLLPQVHGISSERPNYLHKDVNLIVGDVRNAEVVERVVRNVDIVYHFAAHTGVGQSMYQIREYMDVNVQGTAVLLESLYKQNKNLRKLILASSRAVYGEGAYTCPNCGIVSPHPRTITQLQASRWDLSCPICDRSVTPIPTPETHPANPRSVYAVSKLTQEQLCTIFGETYQIPVVILRYFNVYGPRQSLGNPYTGVLSTFITRLHNNKHLNIYEDGLESRDFVYVSDIIQACQLAMEKPTANNQIFNIGIGKTITLMEIAKALTRQLNGSPPQVTGQYRVGDIRHCYADINKACKFLGYVPKITFEQGVNKLIRQISAQHLEDYSDIAEKELQAHGLSAK